MKYSVIKHIVTILLITLALSCSGMSLGMIAHSTADMMPGMDMNSDMHACCGMMESQMDTEDAGKMMLHDTVPIIGLQDQLVSLFILLLALPLLPVLVQLVITPIRQYMYRWQRVQAYFALLFRRLFATGLLHSKVY